MGWAKLDDRYAFHPKLVGDLEARGLDAAAISYCAGQETDGWVPDEVVMALGAGSRNPHAVAKRLVARRRWTRDDARGGYWLHDYLDFNPSREVLESRRKADRFRKGSGRNPSGIRADANGNPGGGRADSSSRTGVGTRAPDPSRPVGTSPPPEHQGVAPPLEEEDPEVEEAMGIVATRRHQARTEPIPRGPRRDAWLEQVAANAYLERKDDLRQWRAEGLSAVAMADRIEPPPARVYEAFPKTDVIERSTGTNLNGVAAARSAMGGEG